MIIDNSDIRLSAQHQSAHLQQHRESLQVFEVDAQGQLKNAVEVSRDNVELSVQAQQLAEHAQRRKRLDQAAIPAQPAQPGEPGQPATPAQPAIPATQLESSAEVSSDQPALTPRMQLMKSIIERITGKSIRLDFSLKAEADQRRVESGQQTSPSGPKDADSNPAVATGMRYEAHHYIEEFEQTDFMARGQVRTADGRQIDFALQLSMARHYVDQSSLVIEAGAKLKDPLVINFEGRAAELRQDRFEFDLDADGEIDSLHQLASHSGMLALDRNGDGLINDGRELFGALSGDGFADLALHDQDGNGFIDEADPVFDQLQVWIKDDQGNDQLLGLKELNIGALYLGSADTPFDLKGTTNELQGRIRATGVYLSETGAAGTLQQLDLVT